VPAAVLLATTALAACANDDVDGSGGTGFVAGKGVITRLAVEDSERPGEVAGETLEGEPISLAEDDVELLGINSRDLDRAAAQAFERRFEVPYPSIHDQQGRTLLAFRGTLSPHAIPSTVGETTRATLVELVEDVLAEDGAR
jgi:hypothetical protein